MYGYSSRNSGICRIHDYAKALEWYNNTPPIRGKGVNAGLRPLGHRNRMHFQIHKADDESILCRLYDTDVVTFKPDGDIIIKPLGYVTMTTANFIGDVLGTYTFIHDRSLQIKLQQDRYRIRNQITIRRDEQGLLRAKEVEKFNVMHINRKAKKDALASVKGFEQYVRNQMKVRDNGKFEAEEKTAMLEELGISFTGNDHNWEIDFHLWREDVSTAALRHKKLVELARSDDIGNWYLAIRWLAFSSARWVSSIHADADTIIKSLHQSIMAVTPSVFVPTEVPAGEVRKNTYRKFEPFIEEARKWHTSTPT